MTSRTSDTMRRTEHDFCDVQAPNALPQWNHEIEKYSTKYQTSTLQSDKGRLRNCHCQEDSKETEWLNAMWDPGSDSRAKKKNTDGKTGEIQTNSVL